MAVIGGTYVGQGAPEGFARIKDDMGALGRGVGTAIRVGKEEKERKEGEKLKFLVEMMAGYDPSILMMDMSVIPDERARKVAEGQQAALRGLVDEFVPLASARYGLNDPQKLMSVFANQVPDPQRMNAWLTNIGAYQRQTAAQEPPKADADASMTTPPKPPLVEKSVESVPDAAMPVAGPASVPASASAPAKEMPTQALATPPTISVPVGAVAAPGQGNPLAGNGGRAPGVGAVSMPAGSMTDLDRLKAALALPSLSNAVRADVPKYKERFKAMSTSPQELFQLAQTYGSGNTPNHAAAIAAIQLAEELQKMPSRAQGQPSMQRQLSPEQLAVHERTTGDVHRPALIGDKEGVVNALAMQNGGAEIVAALNKANPIPNYAVGKRYGIPNYAGGKDGIDPLAPQGGPQPAPNATMQSRAQGMVQKPQAAQSPVDSYLSVVSQKSKLNDMGFDAKTKAAAQFALKEKEKQLAPEVAKMQASLSQELQKARTIFVDVARREAEWIKVASPEELAFAGYDKVATERAKSLDREYNYKALQQQKDLTMAELAQRAALAKKTPEGNELLTWSVEMISKMMGNFIDKDGKVDSASFAKALAQNPPLKMAVDVPFFMLTGKPLEISEKKLGLFESFIDFFKKEGPQYQFGGAEEQRRVAPPGPPTLSPEAQALRLDYGRSQK